MNNEKAEQTNNSMPTQDIFSPNELRILMHLENFQLSSELNNPLIL